MERWATTLAGSRDGQWSSTNLLMAIRDQEKRSIALNNSASGFTPYDFLNLSRLGTTFGTNLAQEHTFSAKFLFFVVWFLSFARGAILLQRLRASIELMAMFSTKFLDQILSIYLTSYMWIGHFLKWHGWSTAQKNLSENWYPKDCILPLSRSLMTGKHIGPIFRDSEFSTLCFWMVSKYETPLIVWESLR